MEGIFPAFRDSGRLLG